MYDGTDYRAIIDIDDTQEITAFEPRPMKIMAKSPNLVDSAYHDV